MRGQIAQAAHTLRYLDKAGNELRGSDEYYGMAGDKPVVSYKYIEGYQPNAYNLKKTLSSDESQNVFEFRYTADAVSADTDDEDEDGAQTGAANADNNTDADAGNGTDSNAGNSTDANAGSGSGGQADGQNSDASDGEPADIIDLDDGSTPLASGADDATGIADSETPKSGISPAAVGGGVVVLAAIAAAAAVIVRRRKVYSDDDDENE